MNWSTENKIKAGFFVLLTALVANGWVSFRATTALSNGKPGSRTTYEVLGHLESTLSTLVDAETGERGYIITGDEYTSNLTRRRASASTATFRISND